MTKTHDLVYKNKLKSIAFYSTSGEDALTVLRLFRTRKKLGIEINHAGKFGVPINIDAVKNDDLGYRPKEIFVEIIIIIKK